MTSKKQLIKILKLCSLSLGSFFILIATLDPYGLFRDTVDRKIYIYHDEPLTKYLLSFNYIPQNFNAVLIGPSVASDIQVSKIDKYNMYNASLRGFSADVSIKLLKVLQNNKNIKTIVICLLPYYFNSQEASRTKAQELIPREKTRSLGSIRLIKMLTKLLLQKMRLSNFVSNWDGSNPNLKNKPMSDKAFKSYGTEKEYKIRKIDLQKVNELAKEITILKQKNIKVIGYWHPTPAPIYNKNIDQFKKFRKQLVPITMQLSKLINFNDQKYKEFNENRLNFNDPIHLSLNGALKLTELINDSI